MKLSADSLQHDVDFDLVLANWKNIDDAGNAMAPAFRDWLHERADLWCAGSSVQHEVYAKLFGGRPAE